MNSLICYYFRAKQALSVTFRVGARGLFFSKRPSRYGCQSLSNFAFTLNSELSLINFSEVLLYNINFTTFWEVPPFGRRQKSNLKKKENYK